MRRKVRYPGNVSLSLFDYDKIPKNFTMMDIATWMKWMNKSILGSVGDCNIYRQIEKIIYE